MLSGVVPIGFRVLSVLSPAGSCLTNKRCQEEPGLPGTSASSQLAQSCSCWKETLEILSAAQPLPLWLRLPVGGGERRGSFFPKAIPISHTWMAAASTCEDGRSWHSLWLANKQGPGRTTEDLGLDGDYGCSICGSVSGQFF